MTGSVQFKIVCRCSEKLIDYALHPVSEKWFSSVTTTITAAAAATTTTTTITTTNVHLPCAHQRPERSHDTY